METIILKIKEDYLKYKRNSKWILFLAILFFIFAFSSQPGKDSKNLSKGFANSVEQVFVQISSNDSSVQTIDFVKIVRKSAHFFLYFFLGIFTFLLFHEYHNSFKKCFLFTILFCSFYGAADEFHQLFVPGRLGKIFDVFIDSCGATCGAIFVLILLKFIAYRKQKKCL